MAGLRKKWATAVLAQNNWFVSKLRGQTMLDFNNKHYACNEDEMRLAISRALEIHGLYEPFNGGFKLFDQENKLQAYISRRLNAKMVVSAYTFPGDGLDRYMNALTAGAEKWLGFPENAKIAQERAAIDSLREFDLEAELSNLPWVIYNPSEYQASGDGAGFWSDKDGWTILSGATRYGAAFSGKELPIGAGPSQMLEIGTMQDFRLMVVENPNEPDLDQTPIIFPCLADDMAHAIEQAVDAYPGCRVLGTQEKGSIDSPLTFTASWFDPSSSRKTKFAISGVAWWRDETSEYDSYTLRVLYAPDGRKLGGPIVTEMGDWRVECDGDYVPAAETEEGGLSPF
jgi:hypothetical protein